jgi:hypothetical protein
MWFFVGFNHSVWHALWILPLSGAVYIGAFFSLADGYYFFDAKHNPGPPNDESAFRDAGDFGPHSQRYQDLAKLLIALSAGVIAFLINTLAGEKTPVAPIVSKIEWSSPIIVGFFGLAIGSLIAFMASQTYWYEAYCQSLKHDTYTRWKYASCITFGVTGLSVFVIGFLWLAVCIFK